MIPKSTGHFNEANLTVQGELGIKYLILFETFWAVGFIYYLQHIKLP